MPAEPTRFATLFNTPTVNDMHALSPREFERFVAYVLRRAGYDAKEVGLRWLRGVDLEMRRPGTKTILGGVECKRYQPGDLVPAGVVSHLLGAAAVSRPGVKSFVITTSDFHENAYRVAEAGARPAYLMNGHQLVRYITYIRGSRYDDDDTISLISPEFFCGRDKPQPPLTGSTKILTVANNKGGVGKTTTAYYLGVQLADQGHRVLLIDLDGQANLTERCFPDLRDDHSGVNEVFPNVAQYFSGQETLPDLIKSTDVVKPPSKGCLSIIPSDPFLTLRDLGGSGRPDVESRFVRDVQKLCTQRIASLGGAPDWIIIDTPPAMSVFTRAGLAAAQYVLAPIRPRNASLTGTRNMLKTVQTMNALLRNSVKFLGVVVTHWDNLKSSQDWETIELLRALSGSGGIEFTTKIPVDNQLESLEPGAGTNGAKAYTDLAVELLTRV